MEIICENDIAAFRSSTSARIQYAVGPGKYSEWICNLTFSIGVEYALLSLLFALTSIV